MTVKIVTDSTCDLPDEIVKELDITVLPCNIHFAGRHYLDGVDITTGEFYERLETAMPYPTSAAPSLGSFTNAYRSLIEKGASAVLSIHVSSKLASTYNTAIIAAKSVASSLIKPFDSGQLSLGTGLIVEAAATAGKAGKTVDAIVDQITQLSKRTYAFAAADTLKYLRRSGRVPQIVAGVGTILQIRPILHIHLGHIGLDLSRTSRQAMARLLTTIRNLGPLEQVSIVHTNAIDKAETLAEAISQAFPQLHVNHLVDVSPAIGVHFGPGAVGFVAVKSAS